MQDIKQTRNIWTIFNSVEDSVDWQHKLSNPDHEKLAEKFSTTVKLIGLVCIAAGVIVIAAWLLNVDWPKSLGPGWATMKFNTALGFVLSGSNLILLTKIQNNEKARQISSLLAISVVMLGILSLTQYLFSWDAKIDQLFVRDIATPIDEYPGRMSPAAALCFSFTGMALLLISQKGAAYSQIFSLSNGFVSLLAIVGYLNNSNSLFDVFIYSSMAIHTAFLFTILSVGLLFATSNHWIMKVYSSGTSAGSSERFLIPMAIVIPILLGATIDYLYYDDSDSASFGFSILVFTSIIMLMIVLHYHVHALFKAEQKRSKIVANLIEANQKYQSLYECASDGILLYSPDKQLVAANPAIVKMVGYNNERELFTATSKGMNDIFAYGDNFPRLVERFIQQGYLEQLETRLKCKDGTSIWVLLNLHNIKSNTGELLYYQVSISDINLLKKAEDDRSKLELRLTHPQRLESIGRLAGGIAHDFNNLLVPILGYADINLQTLEPDSKVYSDLSRIKIAAVRAAELVNKILAFGRKQVLDMQVLNLNEIIKNFREILELMVRDKIELKLELSPMLPNIKGDQGQLEQVLMNLVSNACDAMGDGGTLTIRTFIESPDESSMPGVDETAETYVRLVVSDTGKGMDTETQKHIFEPFFTSKKDGGNGLGLATVYGIINQHQGEIGVQSAINKGTTLQIYLPTTSELPVTVSLPANQQGFLPSQETILVADDDEAIRDLVKTFLEAKNYNILLCDGPLSAIKIARQYQERIDLIITDVTMPIMNGKQLAHKLQEQHPEAAVLYMSGYTQDVISNEGVLEKDTNFIQKPFTMDGFYLAIATAIEVTANA